MRRQSNIIESPAITGMTDETFDTVRQHVNRLIDDKKYRTPSVGGKTTQPLTNSDVQLAEENLHMAEKMRWTQAQEASNQPKTCVIS